MNIDELLKGARDTASVRRVFGEPYAHDGVTVIPVARISGGGGGGAGHDPQRGEGQGGGFGVHGRPVGAYVIKHGGVHWRPAVDVNRVVAWSAAVFVTALLTRARRHPDRTTGSSPSRDARRRARCARRRSDQPRSTG